MGILVILGIIILAALFSDSPSGSGGGFSIVADLVQVAQTIVLKHPHLKEVAVSILKKMIVFMIMTGLST